MSCFGSFSMIRNILIAGLMLMAVAGSTSAATVGYAFNGDGSPEYPNEGYITTSSYIYRAPYDGAQASDSISSITYDTHGNVVNYTYTASSRAICLNGIIATSQGHLTHTHEGYYARINTGYGGIVTAYGSAFFETSTNRGTGVYSSLKSTPHVPYGRYATSTSCICVWINKYKISGDTDCFSGYVELITGSNVIEKIYISEGNSYSFDNLLDGFSYYLNFSDGHQYEFTCIGEDLIHDHDACLWVYGYTCGIDTVKLRDNEYQLIDTANQGSGYDAYEMVIEGGEEYTISFYDHGLILCYDQTFTCTGDHVLINFDRCNWVYPPSPYAPPYIIYTWAGYDYNIVVFKDEHGNFIENSQLAIYDMTSGNYIQKWTPTNDGYALLGARFDTGHDVLLSLRTFDGIFNMETTYPANGSAAVGEEVITTTNWTIPIKYNLDVLPVDQYGGTLFDVFCGISEYTPLNPQAFWGMDLSDQGYVPVTNCSGFAMCDIIAEKDGYADYKVEALNWTSKSALVKDYRHNVVMEEE